MKKKIYCFINSGKNTDWVITCALCEDGHALGGHCSSNNYFAKSDIMGEWKHDAYKKHCPDGFELVWIEDAANSKELNEAYILNQKLAEQEKTIA